MASLCEEQGSCLSGLPFSGIEERKLLTGGILLSFLWMKSFFLLHLQVSFPLKRTIPL